MYITENVSKGKQLCHHLQNLQFPHFFKISKFWIHWKV